MKVASHLVPSKVTHMLDSEGRVCAEEEEEEGEGGGKSALAG